ncbi:MAG: right-handed parallel beta-helix repeat-containing protein, partial [Rhizobiales bacterium]|nr:right-handed parallel beta-helix repeat-containing protein [Hyphomicrobiales bacterium]
FAAIFICTFSTASIAEPLLLTNARVNASDVIKIPSRGFLLDNPVVLRRNLTIRGGSGKLIISKNGQLKIPHGRSLTITDSKIDVQDLSNTPDVSSKAVISLDGGSLTIKRSEVHVRTAYVAPQPTTRSPWDAPPENTLIALSKAETERHHRMRVVIEGNSFTSEIPYSIGLLNLTDDGAIRPVLTIEQRQRFRKSGSFSGNEVKGFHGVFASAGLNKFDIKSNALRENSFVNISLSGRKIRAANNRIYYPGRGTTGDGITALDVLDDVTITDNDIVGGSCYGVLAKLNFSKKVTISRNNIIGGITSAIFIDSLPGATSSKIRDISISGNLMFGNAGFAVAINSGQDIDVSGNQMSDNAPGFPSQIQIRPGLKSILVRGNTKFISADPAWGHDRAMGRTTFSNGDDVFFSAP